MLGLNYNTQSSAYKLTTPLLSIVVSIKPFKSLKGCYVSLNSISYRFSSCFNFFGFRQVMLLLYRCSAFRLACYLGLRCEMLLLLLLFDGVMLLLFILLLMFIFILLIELSLLLLFLISLLLLLLSLLGLNVKLSQLLFYSTYISYICV